MNEKNIELCADDFGINEGVSQGILALVRMRRLSAVSCMVNGAGFDDYAQQLASFKNQVKIGLHFNLTQSEAGFISSRACFSLSEILIKTHLHWIDLSLLEQELHQQLDRFVKMIGFLPDFIDGHQHVHQLPVIRKAVLNVYEQRLRLHNTAIRCTWPILTAGSYGMKAAILTLTGAKRLASALREKKIPHNRCFSGVYDFAPGTDYRALFCSWLASAPEKTLIMCHPGNLDDSPDSIASARATEYAYFASEHFLHDCMAHHVFVSMPHQSQGQEEG